MAQDPALDEHHAGGAALLAGGGDALLDGLAVGQAEVDDDLADHPLRAPRVARRIEALLLLLARPRAVLAPSLVHVRVGRGVRGRSNGWRGDIAHHRHSIGIARGPA